MSAQAGPSAGASTENGDVNGDGRRDISDPLYMLRWLTRGGPAPVAMAQGAPINSFARSVAGTYYAVGDGGSFGTLYAMYTFSADGTVTGSVSGTGGGAGGTEGAFGAWNQTGPNEVTFTTLELFYNQDDGTLEFIFRNRSIVTFADDFSGYTGSGNVIDIFLPFQDPLTDDPVAQIPLGQDFDRLEVMAP